MARNDTISDALTMIRNASRVKKNNVDLPNSKLIKSIVEIFKNEGYIKDFREMENKRKNEALRVYLQYDPNQRPAIKGIKRISRGGLRAYVNANSIPTVLRDCGLAVLSTSKGILTNKQARELKIGGEVICYIW